MDLRRLVLLVVGCALAAPVLAEAPPTPYAGQQARAVKALSAEDIAGLLNGDGMGMAKAAELNGYPGPKHVLDLADRLNLTAVQRRQVQAIFERMSAAARPLGAEVVEQERRLDLRFATRDITAEQVTAETAAIAELSGRLRAVHLAAHLETRAVLTAEQVEAYRQLRGYREPAAPAHHHHG